MVQKWSWKWVKNEWKMATVNNPNILRTGALFEFNFCIHYLYLSWKVFRVLYREELASLSSWLFWLLSRLPFKLKRTLNMQWWLQAHFGLSRVQMCLVFFTLSCVSLKTSSEKAQSKSCSYHDSDYEPRIHASLAGVNEKKYMCLGRQQQEEMWVFCVLFYLSFANK